MLYFLLFGFRRTHNGGGGHEGMRAPGSVPIKFSLKKMLCQTVDFKEGVPSISHAGAAQIWILYVEAHHLDHQPDMGIM